MDQPQDERIKESWLIEEFAFTGALGRLRLWWYSVAARWAVYHLIRQQNQVNQLIRRELLDQAAWLSAQDQDQVALRQQVAELRTQLVQANKRIALLEQQLAD